MLTRLLAKSSSHPNSPRVAETLPGHTALVLASAEKLIEARGQQALAALGLPESSLVRLRRLVLLAAFLHDLGKASDHFQDVVRGLRAAAQLIRHEALALWLAWPGQPLAAWLVGFAGDRRDLLLALAAAAGHHRKFWAHAVATADSGAGREIRLLLAHAAFHQTLRVGCSRLGLPPPPRLSDLVIESSRHSRPEAQIDTWALAWEDEVAPDEATDLLLAASKAFLVAADVAGSALPRGGGSPSWISRALASGPADEGLAQIAAVRLGEARPRPFQEAVASSNVPVTLVRAGCGTGKTVAAYLWASRQHPNRKLWITYPTTGTATEGYRDYVHEAPVAGRLDHSRAAIDVDIFGLDDESDGARDFDRFEALRVWSADVTVCTVDTVLGLLHNQRKGLYAWPSLAHAAIVFDEIHAYDDRLFGSLLRFLQAMPGSPALLMTASLPASRLQALRDLAQRVHRQTLAEVAGPVELEQLPRYQHVTLDDIWPEVERTLDAGRKVLWVSNTVARCRAVGEGATQRGLDAKLYHSRFKYVDRVRRHGDVVDAFTRPGGTFAATTQVAEMSLDLSADLLVTDLAPIPALIQRLGRLNRRARPGDPARPFVVLPYPVRDRPYAGEELKRAEQWLLRLGPGPLSQAALAEAWTEPMAEAPAPAECGWLDGRLRTEPMPVRDLAPSVSVLMQEDAPLVRKRERDPGELALPMLPHRALDLRTFPRIYGLPVVPTGLIDYDPLRGARWRA